MLPFAQTVESWHDFYIMVGTGAATLIGLLFVALSINIESIRMLASSSRNAWDLMIELRTEK